MKISLDQLSTKNLATLAQRLINSSQTGNYAMVDNHPLLLALQNSYTDYDAVYSKATYSGKGKDVATADKERDLIFNNIKAFLNGYRKLPSAPNHQMATDLYDVFKAFGLNITGMSYSAETAQMKKLIEALDKAENLQKISSLSLETAFSELKTKQTEFEQIFAEQAEANGELRQMKSATSLRKDLEKAVRAYLSLITAMKDVEEWKSFYTEMNEIVKAARNSSLSTSSKDQTDNAAKAEKK